MDRTTSLDLIPPSIAVWFPLDTPLAPRRDTHQEAREQKRGGPCSARSAHCRNQLL